MQPEFWHQRWAQNQIGFHLADVNPHLRQHFASVGRLQQPLKRVFVPLCGKSLDIHWLLSQGYQVVGIELSVIAVNALFDSLQWSPTITQVGELQQYQAADLTIFQGDFFALQSCMLGSVDAVYDRAALVALPAAMRVAYTQQLIALTAAAPMLLVCLFYDQNIHAGPPFCVDAKEVSAHYEKTYHLSLLADEAVQGGLKGNYPAREQVWLLTPRA